MTTIEFKIRFTAEEKKKVEREAKRARLSFSNYVRSRLELGPIARGGARANGGRKRAPQTMTDTETEK
jgi:hypothetical protein